MVRSDHTSTRNYARIILIAGLVLVGGFFYTAHAQLDVELYTTLRVQPRAQTDVASTQVGATMVAMHMAADSVKPHGFGTVGRAPVQARYGVQVRYDLSGSIMHLRGAIETPFGAQGLRLSALYGVSFGTLADAEIHGFRVTGAGGLIYDNTIRGMFDDENTYMPLSEFHSGEFVEQYERRLGESELNRVSKPWGVVVDVTGSYRFTLTDMVRIGLDVTYQVDVLRDHTSLRHSGFGLKLVAGVALGNN